MQHPYSPRALRFSAIAAAALTLSVLSGCSQSVDPDGPGAGDDSADQARYQQALSVEAWTGEVSISVDASASGADDYGSAWNHRIFQWARFSGDLTRSGFLGSNWKMTVGTAASQIAQESTQRLGGSTTRYTDDGSRSIPIADIETESYNPLDRGVFLVPDNDSSSFVLHVPAIFLPVLQLMYIDGHLESESENVDILPGTSPQGIKIQVTSSGDIRLSGSRTVRQLIFGAAGDAVELDVSITWELEPTIALPPLDPI